MTNPICECGHPRNEHTDTGGCDELSIGGCDECTCRIFKQAKERQAPQNRDTMVDKAIKEVWPSFKNKKEPPMTEKINGYHFWEVVKIWQESPERVVYANTFMQQTHSDGIPIYDVFLRGEITIDEERHFGMTEDECWALYERGGCDVLQDNGTWQHHDVRGAVRSRTFAVNWWRKGDVRPHEEPKPKFIPYTVDTFPLDRMTVPTRHVNATTGGQIIVRFGDVGIVKNLGGIVLEVIDWEVALQYYTWTDTGDPLGQKVGG